MATFTFTLKHTTGDAEGSIEADSKEDASKMLTEMYSSEDGKNKVKNIKLQQVTE